MESTNVTCYIDYISFSFSDIEPMRPGTFILCVLNAVFAIIAVAGNGVLIAAVLKTPTLQTPTNSLLCSLGVTDFLTGLISQHSFIVYNILRMERDTKLYCRAMLFTSSCGYLLSGVSLFCLTAISFERYLALKLHLRYKKLVCHIFDILFRPSCCESPSVADT